MPEASLPMPDVPMPDVPMPTATILDLMNMPELLGKEFGGPSWAPWRCFMKALYGLPMTDADKALWVKCTGRSADDIPANGFREAHAIVGRRGGKSMAVALIAIFAACFEDWTGCLKPGEKGTIMIVAKSRKQATTILGYITGLINEVPDLAERIVGRERATGIDLVGNVNIEVITCDYRLVRNYTCCLAIGEEVAFWPPEDSVSPDTEVLRALRPSMLTTGGRLILISSAYAKSGVLWDSFVEHWGKPAAKVLVWKAATLDMHPTCDKEFLKAEEARDPVNFDAEFCSNFRDATAEFIPIKSVMGCVTEDITIREYDEKFKYHAFVDPSSGGGKDSFTLAIGHIEKGPRLPPCAKKDSELAKGEQQLELIDQTWLSVDYVFEIKPPFSPDAAAGTIYTDCRRYRTLDVTGDRWATGYVKESFRRAGLRYMVSRKDKSAIYGIALSVIMAGRAILPDDPILIRQLIGLERHTSRGGKDTIDHSKQSHDDVANAVCGLLTLLEALSSSKGIHAIPIRMFARSWDTPGSHIIDFRRRS